MYNLKYKLFLNNKWVYCFHRRPINCNYKLITIRINSDTS